MEIKLWICAFYMCWARSDEKDVCRVKTSGVCPSIWESFMKAITIITKIMAFIST